ncbi:MAG: chromosome segregation protein SMC [Deltaproteobacteria bacterium]|nr:chromosome segregation protein SMC [Deltaproteobacteria bacterium]
MRVKKLEIAGFKSFARRTSVLFDGEGGNERPKIIGIVGPNGCGKSNVVDALLWILGEQSYKELRGKTKDDIIFSGTDIEPAHSFAEVSITLDLDAGEAEKISLDYKDLREVTLTRRIYRSGESEFFLNKTPCRLQDISAFFLDTGAGRGVYSIISQGQIDSLIQSKPEEKRLLIEEASGISAFRMQRRRAHNKLISTEENISRLTDIIKEVGDQLKSLKKYAERAKRYKEAREELRDIDLALAAKTYAELKEQKEDFEEILKSYDHKVEELTLQFNETTKNIYEKEALMAEEREKHEEHQKELLEKSTLLEKKKGQIHFYQNKLNEISKRGEKLALDYRKIDEKKKSFLEQKEKAHRELSEIQKQLSIMKEALHMDSDEENDTLAVKIRKKKEEIQKLREKNLEEQLKLNSLESNFGNLQERKGQLEKDQEGVLEELHKCEESCETVLSNLQEQNRNYEGQKNEYGFLNTQYEELESEIENLKETLFQKEETYRSNNEKLNQTKLSLQMLSRFNVDGDAVNDGKYTYLHELFEIPEKYENLVSLALRGLLKGIVLETRKDVEEFLLKENKPSRFVLIPSDIKKQEQKNLFVSHLSKDQKLGFYIKAKKGYEKLRDFFFGNCYIASDIQSALSNWQEGLIYITDDGYYVSHEGIIYSDRTSQANILQQKRKFEEELKTYGEESSILASHIKELKEKLVSQELELEESQENLESFRESLLNLEHENKYNQEKAHEVEKNIEKVKQRQVTLTEDIKNSVEKTYLQKENIQNTQKQIEKTGQDLSSCEKELGILEECEQDLDLAQKQEKLQFLKEKEGTLLKNLQFFEVELQEALLGLGDSSKTFELLKEESDQSTEFISELQKEIDVLNQECSLLHQKIQEFSSVHKTKLAEITSFKEQNRERERKILTIKDDKHQTTLQLQEVDLKIKYCVDEIRENYVLELQDYYQQINIDFKITDHRQKQKALRAELKSIGEIPLSVISEYEEKQSRFDFLEAQKNDLQSSMGNLHKTITKLDKLSKDKFKETFDKVNREFQKVFPVLFQGGMAKLILTDEENLLETGVDILARPPGKKLQNLNLLSGGEKAMTAIGLIFALFMIRPSPFCVLDEVDAPLDDTNTDRYLQLIQELSERTQFIVVTHNKRTMSKADILYGVTMQDPGISKLVGVQFSSSFVQNLKSPESKPEITV